MNESWQEGTLAQLTDYLQSFDAVQALFLVGSLANDAVQPDFWSDIDLLVVVADQAIKQFYPGTTWLQPISPIFATSQSQDPPRYTLRVCFADMRRVDFIFLLVSAFDHPGSLGLDRFQGNHRLLFSRSSKVEHFHTGEPPAMPAAQDPGARFQAMSNDFWFKATLAVYKVVRNDLLIALHLALDLMRDCLVLKMMLRDREAGTNHHRTGGPGNELLTRLNAQSPDYSPAGILALIADSSQIYEDLAKEWQPDYQAHRKPLLDWIEQAGAAIKPA